MKLLKKSEMVIDEVKVPTMIDPEGNVLRTTDYPGRVTWGHCVIDFEQTPFQLGEHMPALEFDEGIYQGVVPMTKVYGTTTVAVCIVSAVDPT